MAEQPTLAERIGGRWAISLRSWVVVIVLTTLAAPISTPLLQQDSGRQRLVIFIVSLIAGLAIGVLMLLADRTLLRHRRERPVASAVVVAFGVVLGVVHALLTLLFYGVADMPETFFQPIGRIVVSALLGPALIITCALVFEELDRYAAQRERLLARLIALREQDAERSELSDTIEAAVQAEVRVATDPILAELTSPAAGGQDERYAMAERLQAVATEQLRPLSQRLDAAEAAPMPDLQLREALWASLLRQRLAPGAVAIVTGLLFLLFNYANYGLATGLGQGFVQAGIVYAALWPIARRAERDPDRRFPALLLGALAVMAVTGVKSLIFQTVILDEARLAPAAAALIWTPILTITISVIVAAVRQRNDSLEDLELVVDERTLEAILLNRELVRVSRNLARHVHGTLQSTLLATAFAIESATRTNDAEAFDRAVEEARIALQTAPRIEPPAASLEAEVARRLDLWRGFTEVETRIEVDHEPPASVVRDLGRALEEAISNAKKHGRAHHVAVAVEHRPDALRLTVADDGSGPVGGVPGLGSRAFDEIAPGGWWLSARPEGGALLVIDIPLAAATG